MLCGSCVTLMQPCSCQPAWLATASIQRGMGDSWEDQEDNMSLARPAEHSRAQPRAGGLNPNASSFSFNPGAATFAPTGFAQPQAAPPGFVMPSYPPPSGGSVLPPTSAASSSASSPAPSELARGAAEVAGPSTTQPAGADRVANGPTAGECCQLACHLIKDMSTQCFCVSVLVSTIWKQSQFLHLGGVGFLTSPASKDEQQAETLPANCCCSSCLFQQIYCLLLDKFGLAPLEQTSMASAILPSLAGPSANAAIEKLEDLKLSSSTPNGPSADKKSPDKQTPAAPDEEEDETEDEAARAKREAELQQIYEELAKEDPRLVAAELISSWV